MKREDVFSGVFTKILPCWCIIMISNIGKCCVKPYCTKYWTMCWPPHCERWLVIWNGIAIGYLSTIWNKWQNIGTYMVLFIKRLWRKINLQTLYKTLRCVCWKSGAPPRIWRLVPLKRPDLIIWQSTLKVFWRRWQYCKMIGRRVWQMTMEFIFDRYFSLHSYTGSPF